MNHSRLTTLHYLIAAEDSRPGRMDVWNHVFLARRSALGRSCLEMLKITWVIGLAFATTVALSLL